MSDASTLLSNMYYSPHSVTLTCHYIFGSNAVDTCYQPKSFLLCIVCLLFFTILVSGFECACLKYWPYFILSLLECLF